MFKRTGNRDAGGDSVSCRKSSGITNGKTVTGILESVIPEQF